MLPYRRKATLSEGKAKDYTQRVGKRSSTFFEKNVGEIVGATRGASTELRKNVENIGWENFWKGNARLGKLMGLRCRWVFTSENRGISVYKNARHFGTAASGDAIRKERTDRRSIFSLITKIVVETFLIRRFNKRKFVVRNCRVASRFKRTTRIAIVKPSPLGVNRMAAMSRANMFEARPVELDRTLVRGRDRF